VIVLAAILMIAWPAIPALAVEPTTVSLDGIELFHDLIAADDILAVVPYNVAFSTAPDENIDETFIFRFMSPDGSTEYGSTLATPAYDGGYGNGVVSFYFTSGVTWGESYIVRVQENPAYYPAATAWDFGIGDDQYSNEADQAAALKAKVVDSATFLSTVFGVSLLSASESGAKVLSTYGELYYLSAIPGLQQMAPALFQVQLETPDFSKRSWSTSFADALFTKYQGTFIYDAMTGYAGLFSTTTSAAMTTLSILWVVFLMGIAVWKFRASMLSSFTDAYAVLLLLMLVGAFPMVAAGGIAFISVVMGGIVLFLNRS
jgi:hypothetical protein